LGGHSKERLVTPPSRINAAIRSVIWLGGAACYAYVKKPDGASCFAVRPDSIGWLGGGLCFAGLALHFCSNVSLARGERQGTAGTSALVTDGPFGYVRNPIYLAGITLLLGVGLLYPTWHAKDLVLPLLLLAYFHLAVVRVEEPALRRHFGSTYEEYCKRVPRWFPAPTSPSCAARQGDAAGGASRRS
jgi:protein-S-isoprenylcysteine O-methyltransferase Ste14